MKRIGYTLLTISLVVLLSTGIGQADTFELTGNFLKVGISNSGGLIDDNLNSGIRLDPLGTGYFPASPPAVDFLRPGTPFEFYSIGINGIWNAAGYGIGNPFGLTSENTSSGNMLSAFSYGTYVSPEGTINFTLQTSFFDKNSKEIGFSVNIINAGPDPIHVVYARGMDPDQDAYPFGSYSTTNSIGANVVKAIGPLTGHAISIVDLTGYGVPTVDAGWDTNPYNLLNPHNAGNGNHTINMAWDLGTLNPQTSKEIEFKYVITPIPIPTALLLLGSGLLGLAGLGRMSRKKD